MIIYDNTGKSLLDIQVDDDSYRYRAIAQSKRVELHYSLPGHVEIPVGSYVEYQGERYTLWRPSDLEKRGTRNFGYKVTLGGDEEILKRYKYKLLSDKPYKLRFTLTAKPGMFVQLLVDNLNLYDSGWTVGTVIEGVERPMSLNHESCWAVLGRLAQELDTEFEIVGKTVNLGKVERFKDSPVKLSYGKGNGFKTGVGRTGQGDGLPVEILYVQGGDRNIDRSSYGSDTLLLPRSREMEYGGRRYMTDPDGMYVTRADKAPVSHNEDSYDAGHIHPGRVGEVTGVSTEHREDTAGNPVTFYNITDTTIPDALDYRDCRMDGNKATVIFQSGRLAGREFDIAQTDKDLTGYDHATRTLKLVSVQEDGMTLPNASLRPVAGDKYAVFNIKLPGAYICDNATKTGASWDMFREAVRYLREREEERFTFTGELDGIYARRNWLAIGGKLVPGGHVDFSDTQFQPEGIPIRITGIRDYINKPHSPELELSNTPVAGFLPGTLGKLEAGEVTVDDRNKRAIQFTRRSFRDARETMGMLADSLLANFTESINPIAVATMQLLVGDGSLQFRFVDGETDPVVVDDGIRYDKGRKVLAIPAGTIQHMTLGITDISPKREYRFWDMGSYESPYLEPGKRYYLYARCSGSTRSGSYLPSEKAIGMGDVPGHYHLLVGVLNSEYDGERSFAPMYGYTEISPGRVTADRVVSSDGQNYMDLVKNAFRVGDTGNYLDWNSRRDGKLRLKGTIIQSESGDESRLGCFRGVYDPGHTYYEGDEATYTHDGGTSTYRWIYGTYGKGYPPTNTTYWRVVSSQGSNGIDGDPGPCVTYRGIYDPGKIYYGTPRRIDAVKYNGVYHVARVDAGNGFSGTAPTDTGRWNDFGAQFDSVATNLLLTDNASIGSWWHSGGKIVSTLSDGNKITLDASMAQIIIESAYSGGESSLDKYLGARITLDASKGIIEARGESDTSKVAYMSPSGMFCNSANTRATPSTSSLNVRAAIVGLGYGDVSRDDVWNTGNFLAAFYGYASNSGNAPAYGGYFRDLMAAGLILNRRVVDSGGVYLNGHDTFVVGYSQSECSVYLPNDGVIGRIVLLKQRNVGSMRCYARGGQKIYDDDSVNSYFLVPCGSLVIAIFDRCYINGVLTEAWLINSINTLIND